MSLATHFELWQPPNEGSKLLLSRSCSRRPKHSAHQSTTPAPCRRLSKASAAGCGSGQARFSFFNVLLCQIRFDGGVELGLKESEEEVEEVDEEGVTDCSAQAKQGSDQYDEQGAPVEVEQAVNEFESE